MASVAVPGLQPRRGDPRIRPAGLLGLLALFGDAVYFLVLVSFGVGRLWLASFIFSIF